GNQFVVSAILAGVTFFGVGTARALVTAERFWVSGLEIFLVGGAASMVAYGIGWLIKTMFGIVI
ncbi:MAG: hypothetical protein HYW96_01310, partial [Candidatus Wildermuthbacteria bacterium]|nr:hypothetical protein [Candidatus Wildermuthbacteria bacterium]